MVRNNVGDDERTECFMNGELVNGETEEEEVWMYAMELRLACAQILQRAGPLWRAALFLSLSEELSALDDEYESVKTIDSLEDAREEKRRGIIERYDTFGTAILYLGLIGVWDEKPLIDGAQMTSILSNIPKGPEFRVVMDAQVGWMITHPGGSEDELVRHLQQKFFDYL
mmetsp:Transcript_13169/g.19985  ORF Transcript_13169/g.19985 Transcript_13169/m.19985 type:complete len:170 (-) Transcript_13169:49-558(-)